MIFDIVGKQDDFGDIWFLSLICRPDGKIKDEWCWTELMTGVNTAEMIEKIEKIRGEKEGRELFEDRLQILSEIMSGISPDKLVAQIKKVQKFTKGGQFEKEILKLSEIITEKSTKEMLIRLKYIRDYKADEKGRNQNEKAVLKLGEKDIDELKKAVGGIVPAYVEESLICTTGSACGEVDNWLRSTQLHWSELDTYEHDSYFLKTPSVERKEAREEYQEKRKEHQDLLIGNQKKEKV